MIKTREGDKLPPSIFLTKSYKSKFEYRSFSRKIVRVPWWPMRDANLTKRLVLLCWCHSGWRLQLDVRHFACVTELHGSTGTLWCLGHSFCQHVATLYAHAALHVSPWWFLLNLSWRQWVGHKNVLKDLNVSFARIKFGFSNFWRGFYISSTAAVLGEKTLQMVILTVRKTVASKNKAIPAYSVVFFTLSLFQKYTKWLYADISCLESLLCEI